MSTYTFNDETNYNGHIQECERKLFNSNYGHISDDDKLRKTLTTYINNALDWYDDLAFRSDTAWQRDDNKYTTFPNYTQDLVDDQDDYELDDEFVKVLGVAVLNSDGKYYTVHPIDQRDTAQPLESLYEAKGVPEYYDIIGDTVRLYPAPVTSEVSGAG